MKHFTPHEQDKIRCELRNKGQGPANDELLNVVRTKPNTFADLLVSLRCNHNEAFFKELWSYVE